MHIHIVSIFPDIFKSFIETSLIKKAVEKWIVKFSFVNPRTFAPDRHQTVDDTIYGGWAGLLMKAKPFIDSVESIIKKLKTTKGPLDKANEMKSRKAGEGKQKGGFAIVLPSPSKDTFTQKTAHSLSTVKDLIFVCTRYEGIDYRFEQYMKKKYPKNFQKISLWHFITLGGETPAMVMIEAITRLIPGVIKEEASRQDESYSVQHNMQNLEYPQYTKPEKVLDMKVPKVLLSGHHAKIQERRDKKTKILAKKKTPWKKPSKKN